MPQQLDGKIAVITGAASGIGLATVELFVEAGARVLAADLNADEGQALADRFPGVVRFMRCDVTQTAQIKAAIDGAAEAFGGLDILFSNAGAGGSTGGRKHRRQIQWQPAEKESRRQPLGDLAGPQSGLLEAAFSPDGRRLAIAGHPRGHEVTVLEHSK